LKDDYLGKGVKGKERKGKGDCGICLSVYYINESNGKDGREGKELVGWV